MITIKGIAKEANVSEGTVDRVIHNRGGVSKKTEAKIKKILDYHNFSVNPIASALAKKNKYAIAALVPNFDDSNLFWKYPNQGILKGAEDVKTFGMQVTTFNYNQYNADSYLNTFNTLLKTKPHAVILVPNFYEETKQIANRLKKRNIPYLFLNIDIKGFENMAFVGQDAYMAGYIAGKLMHLNLPNTRALLIIQARLNITKNNAVYKRIQGFNDYFLKNNPIVKIKTLKIENLNSSAETKNKINTYLDEHNQIEGIFVPSSRIYYVVDCLEAAYLEKMKLIGFDNTPQNIKCLQDNVISFLISQKPFDQGYEAVRLLTNYLLENKLSKSNFYLPIDILIKENVTYNS